MRDRLDRIPHNRAKKHLRLFTFLRSHLRRDEPRYLAETDDEATQLLDEAHEALTPGEWEMECRLACGETYAEIADGVSPTALKMRAGRWRAKIREAIAV